MRLSHDMLVSSIKKQVSGVGKRLEVKEFGHQTSAIGCRMLELGRI